MSKANPKPTATATATPPPAAASPADADRAAILAAVAALAARVESLRRLASDTQQQVMALQKKIGA